MIRVLVFFLLAASLPLGAADSKATTANAQLETPPKGSSKEAPQDIDEKVPVRDFGSAIDRLLKLGLPDAKGASRVSLTLYEKGIYWDKGSKVEIDEDEDTEMMMAWMMPGQEDGMVSFICQETGVISVCEFRKKEGRSLTRGEILKEMKPLPDRARLGYWEVIDEKEVAEHFDGFLKILSEYQEMNFAEITQKYYPILFEDACYWYRAGYQKKANIILSRFFQTVDSPVLIIDRLVNKLGDWRYRQAMESFEQSKDWRVLRRDLKAIIEEFSRGWRSLEAVKILEQRVGLRLQASKPTPLHYKSHPLNVKAIAALDQVLSLTKEPKARPQVFWVLGTEIDKIDDIYDYYDYPHDHPAWMQTIMDQGMDGFLALVSLVQDETLIPVLANSYPQHSVESESGSSFQGEKASNDPEALILAQYENLRCPISRGEVAASILRYTMSGNFYSEEEITREAFQKKAYRWWLEHRTDTRPELAQHFMMQAREQNNQDSLYNNQMSIAIMAMIHFETDENVKALEGFFLQEGVNFLGMLEPYLRSRGPKARGFLKKYAVALESAVAYEGDDSSFKKDMLNLGGVPVYLKKLLVYTDELSPEDVLALMRSEKVTSQEGLLMMDAATGHFTSEVGCEIPSRYIPALVSIARQKPTLKKQLKFLSRLKSWVQKKTEYYYGPELTKAFNKARPLTLKESKDDWRYFLSQDVALDDPKLLDRPSTVAAYSAELIEEIYFSGHEYSRRMYRIQTILDPHEYREFLVKRSLSLFGDGEAVLAWPDADRVSDERLKAIREELMSMPAEQIVDYYQKRPLDEKMIWSSILKSFGKNLPSSLTEWQRTVTKVDWRMGAKSDVTLELELERKVRRAIQYKHLDKNLILQLMNVLLDHEGGDPMRWVSIYHSKDEISGLRVSSLVQPHIKQWRGSRGLPQLDRAHAGESQKGVGVILNNEEGGKSKERLLIVKYHSGRKRQNQHDIDKQDKVLEKMLNRLDKAIKEGGDFSLTFFTEG